MVVSTSALFANRRLKNLRVLKHVKQHIPFIHPNSISLHGIENLIYTFSEINFKP